MSTNSQPLLNHSDQAQIQLMDCLLASSTIEYPWNYAEPEIAAYYTQSDLHFSLDDWSDAEIKQRSQSFFARIKSCWSSEAQVNSLDALIASFGDRVPHQWLAQIATNVGKLATSHLEPVEKLVQSVETLLSNWATDDLLVMARPYVYAMRCDPGVDNPNNIVRHVDWDRLSEIERAKLTILIAQYAITYSAAEVI